MNKRQIILDFTSLLDVIMIILFYFILFSHFEVADAKDEYEKVKAIAEKSISEADARMSEADDLKYKYEEKLQEAEEIKKQAEELLSQASKINERNPANLLEINKFDNNKNLKIRVVTDDGYSRDDDDKWHLSLYIDENVILGNVKAQDELAMEKEIANIMSSAGYTEGNTILCVLIEDSDIGGSNRMSYLIKQILDLLKDDFPYFFYTDIDISALE